MAILLPSDLGLNPAIFPSFREGQEDLSTQLALSPHRFPLLNAPCGAGKSLIYFTSALMFDLRLLILTPQKALQDQLMHDFGPSSGGPLVDVRGQSNYSCPNFRNCEIGAANECPLRRLNPSEPHRCGNLKAIDRARDSKYVVTNNSFWMTQGRAQSTPSESGPPPGIGKFDLIVIDEGHAAPDKLADFCTITLFVKEVESLLEVDLPDTSSLPVWSQWARSQYPRISSLLKEADSPRSRMRLRAIERDLIELSGIATDRDTRWIYQYSHTDDAHTFTPVWASPYAERLLFQGAGKVIITSATLLPNIGEYLGIPPIQSEYIDVASTFPPENRPLFYCPSGVKLTRKSTESDYRIIAAKYDEVIDLWGGYNGLYHTQSHALTEKLYSLSRNKDRIIVYEKGDAASAISLLKEGKRKGLWVMGPGLKEGFDLPGDAARAQIVAKIIGGAGNMNDPVTKARCESNPNYFMDQTSVQLTQTVGRIVRSRTDWGYTYTCDGQFPWVAKDGRFAQSFRDAIRWEKGRIPGPPKGR